MLNPTTDKEITDKMIAYIKARCPHREFEVSALELANTLDWDDRAGAIAIGALLAKTLKGIIFELRYREEEVPFDYARTVQAIDAMNAKDPLHITALYNIVMPYEIGGVWKDGFDGMPFKQMRSSITQLRQLGYPVFVKGQTDEEFRAECSVRDWD